MLLCSNSRGAGGGQPHGSGGQILIFIRLEVGPRVFKKFMFAILKFLVGIYFTDQKFADQDLTEYRLCKNELATSNALFILMLCNFVEMCNIH